MESAGFFHGKKKQPKKPTCGQPCSPQGGWKNPLIPSCFNSSRKINCRAGLGRKLGTTAAGEESQVFLEACFCFEWNLGVSSFSLRAGGRLWGPPRLVVSVLSAAWGQNPFPRADSRAVIPEEALKPFFVSPAQRDSSWK